MEPFVSKKEREDIAKRLAHKIDGANTQMKIVDINTLAEEIQEQRRASRSSMIINIKAIIARKNHESNKGITIAKDPNYNCIYGIFVQLDTFKNILYSRIEMSEDIVLNLENIEDAKRWAVIRMHPSVKGSPFASDPMYEVIDPTIEAQKTEKRVDIIQRLFELINKMNGTELTETMRYLGMSTNNSLTLKVAKGALLDAAIKTPEAIYDKLTDKRRGVEGKLRTAIELSIVNDHPEKGILYNEIPLGINMNDAIDRLMKDKTIYASILESVDKMDIVAQNIQNEYVESNKSESSKKNKTDKLEM